MEAAKVCEQLDCAQTSNNQEYGDEFFEALEMCAAAIRALKKEKP